jgi:hypothetical protein
MASAWAACLLFLFFSFLFFFWVPYTGISHLHNRTESWRGDFIWDRNTHMYNISTVGYPLGLRGLGSPRERAYSPASRYGGCSINELSSQPAWQRRSDIRIARSSETTPAWVCGSFSPCWCIHPTVSAQPSSKSPVRMTWVLTCTIRRPQLFTAGLTRVEPGDISIRRSILATWAGEATHLRQDIESAHYRTDRLC